jgi:hypothetical protein
MFSPASTLRRHRSAAIDPDIVTSVMSAGLPVFRPYLPRIVHLSQATRRRREILAGGVQPGSLERVKLYITFLA